MEQVVDKLIRELEAFSQISSQDGGMADIMHIESIYFGDPGILPVYNYPAFTVQPVRDAPVSETTGYEIRNLEVLITLTTDAREFFESDVEEATGDRKLVQAAFALRAWLRRTANRQLDGEAGKVREVAVSDTNYVAEARDPVIAKSAQLTLTVNKQYQRQE